jgi:hypothetical protein
MSTGNIIVTLTIVKGTPNDQIDPLWYHALVNTVGLSSTIVTILMQHEYVEKIITTLLLLFQNYEMLFHGEEYITVHQK